MFVGISADLLRGDIKGDCSEVDNAHIINAGQDEKDTCHTEKKANINVHFKNRKRTLQAKHVH